ncbi:MAG: hypothetical protein PHU53_03805 [Thermoplasmata archaeon]|nr:hypothetical protein [Thermoplasmata archaeon]
MLGTGYPTECYRPVCRAASESAHTLSLHEFGNSDSAWLMAEAQQSHRPAKSSNMIHAWLSSVRAAASKVAAMLF